MNWVFPALLVSSFVAAPYQAARGEPARVIGSVDCTAFCFLDIQIIGQIDSSTVEQVKRLIDERHERAIREKKGIGTGIEMISLNSPGGSVTAAMAIGRMVRKERFTVTVPVSGVCHSACVLIFAGGVTRANLGKLGIHRPYLEVQRQEVSSENVRELYQQMLQEIRSYFREMNVSEQLADAMLRIEPDKIRLLNVAALESYGLTPMDPSNKRH